MPTEIKSSQDALNATVEQDWASLEREIVQLRTDYRYYKTVAEQLAEENKTLRYEVERLRRKDG